MNGNVLLMAAVITLNLIHVGAFVWTLLDRSRFWIIPGTNALFGGGVLLYWIWCISVAGMDVLDDRIKMLLVFEAVLIALFAFGLKYKLLLLKIGSSVGFGIHFLFLIAALLFCFTYKARMM